MRFWKPIVTLLLLTTIVPELLTGSTPLTGFSFGMFLWLGMGYGLAVLVLREYTVRHDLGFGGIFKLGLAYAIFNEGLLAKTMIIESNLPIPQFNYYGYHFGFSIPNIVMIAPWHAFASVLVPILITYYLFPRDRGEPWLGKKTATGIVVVLFLFASSFFLGPARLPGQPIQLAILLGVILFVVIHATRFPGVAKVSDVSSPWSINPVLLGFSIFPFSFLTFAIAGMKLPLVIFLAVNALGMWFYIRTLKSNGWLTVSGIILFGLGSYMQTTLTGFIVAIMAQLPDTDVRIVTAIIAEIVLLLCILKMRSSLRKAI